MSWPIVIDMACNLQTRIDRGGQIPGRLWTGEADSPVLPEEYCIKIREGQGALHGPCQHQAATAGGWLQGSAFKYGQTKLAAATIWLHQPSAGINWCCNELT